VCQRGEGEGGGATIKSNNPQITKVLGDEQRDDGVWCSSGAHVMLMWWPCDVQVMPKWWPCDARGPGLCNCIQPSNLP
jgi:hypothetical protein